MSDPAAALALDFEAVEAAERVIRELLPPTPLRNYPLLDEAVGHGVRLLVKHENHQPTNSFKVRNGIVALSLLDAAERSRGLVTATRGNHGQGLAWACARAGVPVVVCVPHGNNPEKNRAMEALGAELVVSGATYDESLEKALEIRDERGATFVHSTDHEGVLAGAATIALEVLREAPEVEAFVLSAGGGSQAVGALTVTGALAPTVPVYGVQAAAAPTLHDSWHAGRRTPRPVGETLADGLATGDVYGTFPRLQEGLADFVTVEEGEIAAAIRLLLETTHNLVEGGGACGVAGVRRLGERLSGTTVAVYLSGGNIDQASLRRVLGGS